MNPNDPKNNQTPPVPGQQANPFGQANPQDPNSEAQQQGSESRTQNPTQAQLATPPAIEMPKMPGIELPKGGGAIQGIGEKFQANPVTGTGSFSVPIALSPGRGGFGPALGLSYDSGAGNSPFGIGWNVGVASISRKTQKELPTYQNEATQPVGEIPHFGPDWEDTFIMSGAEDLVPKLVETSPGVWEKESYSEGEFNITRYRPRTEGGFARIEYWKSTVDGIGHWRSISRENITTLYGKSEQARIAHPTDPTRIFQWKIERTYDDKGNIVVFEYKKEDGTGIPKEDLF